MIAVMDRIASFSDISFKRPVLWLREWKAPLIMMGLVLVLLLPWAMHEGLVKALNHDIFWLLTGLERLLDGRSMFDAAYETNPPLSFFIYLPVYLLAAMGLSLESSMLVSVFTAVLLSAFAVYRLLAGWLDIDRVFASGMSGIYVIAVTALIVPEFGQRDHLLALGLVPFLLAQFALGRTESLKKPDLLIWGVCFAGAFLMLLKPHYGIIPALMIAGRFVQGRRFLVLRDPDVVALGVLVTLYAAVLALFFRDYLNQILPVVLQLYGSFGSKVSKEILLIFVIFNGAVLAASIGVEQKQTRHLAWIFTAGSFLALIPYVLMQKGFAYHLVPASIFLFLAIGALLQQGLRKNARPCVAMVAAILLMAAGAMLLPHTPYPTRDDVRATSLTQALAYEPGAAQKCEGECRFLILGVSIRATQLSSHYAGGEQGSRFATLWFVPGLIKKEISLRHSNDTEKKQDHLQMKAKFLEMLRQDIVNWRPDRLLFCNQMQDLAYFGGDTILKESPYEYRLVKTLPINRHEYFPAVEEEIEQCMLYDRAAP